MTSERSKWLFLLLSIFAIFLLVYTDTVHAEQREVLIAILNPLNKFHEKKAELLKRDIELQYKKDEGLLRPNVVLLNEEKIQGAWTMLPLISRLINKCPNCLAVIFCDENIEIKLKILTNEFLKLDFTQELFGGRSLQDSSPTIVHHYNFKNDLSFKYPDFASGFFLSMALVKKLAEKFDRSKAKIDFTIDPYYELSQFIFDDGRGVNLTSFNFICGAKEKSEKCALTCGAQNPACHEFKTENEDVLVAVKTCNKFHESRVPVLNKTWGHSVNNIIYFSDVANESIPTHFVGVPNTEQGHCKKFFMILEKCSIIMEQNDYKWLLVVDDDTLVSFERLLNLLSCYDSQDIIFLGERYGYGVVSGHGYDYVTLGGGMVISRKGLEKVVKSDSCGCSKDDAPDDMTMGMCLLHIGLPITHSSLFHQARPSDYAAAYLENQLPISFHRYWENDPYEVYNMWLKKSTSSTNKHEPRSDL